MPQNPSYFWTYTPWDEKVPGFLEIDTVSYDGTTTEGEYDCTLSTVDLATGWTECHAVIGKTQSAVHRAHVGSIFMRQHNIGGSAARDDRARVGVGSGSVRQR